MTRLATWNVNSLRARQEFVEEWMSDVQPDVLCLQETKLADDAFPTLTFTSLGYESVHHGEGRWNGVAILSRIGLVDIVHGFADDDEPDPEARLVTARCGDTIIVNCYAPNGRSLDHEQYQYKLAWFERLVRHLDNIAARGESVIVCGDLNIAPDDIDVWDMSQVHGATHVSAPERARFAALLEWGLIDLVRQQYPEVTGLYSWWDYRAGNFHKHKGMRIDHLLATPDVAETTSLVVVDRNARKGKGTSDHAPVIVDH